MAYMRGHTYIWDDEEAWVHIWVADGYDYWDEASWHLDDSPGYPITADHCEDGRNIASGVRVPQETMDEYVVMRMAEMIDEGLLESAIERALTKWSRESLQKHADLLKRNVTR